MLGLKCLQCNIKDALDFLLYIVKKYMFLVAILDLNKEKEI